MRPSQIAGCALIAGLQERGLIEGPWRADRERCLAVLIREDPARVGDCWDWVAEAMALLGVSGYALGIDLKGIAPGDELAVQALLLAEAELLELEGLAA